jgi:hypothetical protein
MTVHSIVLQEGDAPYPIAVLHYDGTVSRLEIGTGQRQKVVVRTRIAEGKELEVRGFDE